MEVSACHVMFVDVDDVMLVPSVITHLNRGVKCFFEVNCQKEVRAQHTASSHSWQSFRCLLIRQLVAS